MADQSAAMFNRMLGTLNGLSTSTNTLVNVARQQKSSLDSVNKTLAALPNAIANNSRSQFKNVQQVVIQGYSVGNSVRPLTHFADYLGKVMPQMQMRNVKVQQKEGFLSKVFKMIFFGGAAGAVIGSILGADWKALLEGQISFVDFGKKLLNEKDGLLSKFPFFHLKHLLTGILEVTKGNIKGGIARMAVAIPGFSTFLKWVGGKTTERMPAGALGGEWIKRVDAGKGFNDLWKAIKDKFGSFLASAIEQIVPILGDAIVKIDWKKVLPGTTIAALGLDQVNLEGGLLGVINRFITSLKEKTFFKNIGQFLEAAGKFDLTAMGDAIKPLKPILDSIKKFIDAGGGVDVVENVNLFGFKEIDLGRFLNKLVVGLQKRFKSLFAGEGDKTIFDHINEFGKSGDWNELKFILPQGIINFLSSDKGIFDAGGLLNVKGEGGFWDKITSSNLYTSVQAFLTGMQEKPLQTALGLVASEETVNSIMAMLDKDFKTALKEDILSFDLGEWFYSTNLGNWIENFQRRPVEMLFGQGEGALFPSIGRLLEKGPVEAIQNLGKEFGIDKIPSPGDVWKGFVESPLIQNVLEPVKTVISGFTDIADGNWLQGILKIGQFIPGFDRVIDTGLEQIKKDKGAVAKLTGAGVNLDEIIKSQNTAAEAMKLQSNLILKGAAWRHGAKGDVLKMFQQQAEQKVKSFLTPGDEKPAPEAKPEKPADPDAKPQPQASIKLDADFKKVTDGIVGALVGNTGKTLMEVIETSNEKLITAIESIQPSTVAMVAPGGQQIQMPAGTGPNTSARKLNI